MMPMVYGVFYGSLFWVVYVHIFAVSLVINKYYYSNYRLSHPAHADKKYSSQDIRARYNISGDDYHKVRYPKKKHTRIGQIRGFRGSDAAVGDAHLSDVDTIIIGSGIGGLTTAALLAKSGKRVMVLEQHTVAGGTTHAFVDHGVEHEVGLHYVGNIPKLQEIFDIVGGADEMIFCGERWWKLVGGNIKWAQMGAENPDGKMIYDEIHIGDQSYRFEAGEENLTTYLKSRFPGETDAIDKYFVLVKKASKKNMFFMLKVFPWKWVSYFIRYIDPDYYSFVNQTVTDVLAGLTKNKQLISVLCGQYGDYGMVPSKAPFFFHAAVVNHYLSGGWFPRGGTSVIAKNICKTIFENGGRVYVGCGVKQIITEPVGETMLEKCGLGWNNLRTACVKGVKMENGDVIYADEVVSNVGLRNTFERLVTDDRTQCGESVHGQLIDFPADNRPKGIDVYKKLLDNIKPSTQHVYCFVKLRGDPASLGLRSSNLWIYPHGDYDTLEEEFLKDPLEAPMPMFMGFSCMKDPEWNDNFPGVSNAIILTLAKKEWFVEWEDSPSGRRGDVYNDYKDRIGERMIEEGLYKFFPKTRGNVEHFDMGTPLTTKHYLGATNGESYGLDINKYRLLSGGDLRPKTPIHGLYLTGQDICTLGVSGALSSGVMTASVMMGYDNLIDIMMGNNIIADLQRKYDVAFSDTVINKKSE